MINYTKALLIAGGLICCNLYSAEVTPHRVLFLMQAGHSTDALTLYKEHVKETGRHDYELLQNIGLLLLEQGYRTGDPETQLLTLYGAGLALHERVLPLLEEGLSNSHPELQLISLNFLSRYQSSEGDEAINQALASNYLIIRLEAAYQLAKKRSPLGVAQGESLMCKVVPELLPLFPQIFAAAGTADAMAILRKLLNNSDNNTRLAAIQSIAEHKRDDLLPTIRTLATHHNGPQQEACAHTLGLFKDELSANKLEVLSTAASSNVRLAAWLALYRMGRLHVKESIENLAKTEDLFAITALGSIPGSEDLLYELSQSSSPQVRINANLALLKRKDRRCLRALADVLLKDSRDLAIVITHSPGKTLISYKLIPSAKQNLSDNPVGLEMALQMREEIVLQALELPEDDFLKLAQLLFDVRQQDLVPVVVESLASLHTPKAIAVLKQYHQKAGAPLIRNYCNLTLYKLKEEGPYAEHLCKWVATQQQTELIKFRPILPLGAQELDKASAYQLTPQETSRLLIEAFAAFTERQDETGINALIDAIQNGQTKNRYTLAGLLVRAAQ